MIVEHLCVRDALALATTLSGASCRALEMALLDYFRDRFDQCVDVVRVRRLLSAALAARLHDGESREPKHIVDDQSLLPKLFDECRLNWSVEPNEPLRLEFVYRGERHELLTFGRPSSRRKYSHLFFPRISSKPLVYAIVERTEHCTHVRVHVRFGNDA
jgi:hypothetical protein